MKLHYIVKRELASESNATTDVGPLLLFSLVKVQNQSFGPKQNTKFTVNHHPPPPTTHLPKTFCRVLGIVRG